MFSIFRWTVLPFLSSLDLSSSPFYRPIFVLSVVCFLGLPSFIETCLPFHFFGPFFLYLLRHDALSCIMLFHFVCLQWMFPSDHSSFCICILMHVHCALDVAVLVNAPLCGVCTEGIAQTSEGRACQSPSFPPFFKPSRSILLLDFHPCV